MGVPSGPFYIDDTMTFTVTTHRFDTGALTDADAVPPYRIYEDETGTAILTGNTAKLDDAGTTGFYSEQITLSAANGFEVGKSYAIYVTATVNSVVGGQSFNFKVIATPTTPPTAAVIADAVWDEDATGHQTGGTFGQAIGDPGADTTTIYQSVVTDAAGTHVAADIIAIKTQTAAIETDTAEIGAAGAGLTNINLPNQIMDIVGNITGNLSGSVGSVTGLTASDVGAIKAKTDSLAFTVAGQVDANIQYVNDTEVNGDGSPGTEWGP